MRVDQNAGFAEDFDLAHRCLQGDEQAIAVLQEEFGETVRCFLIRAGAQSGEAQEVVSGLWTDLLVQNGQRMPRLYHYHGNCALLTWLNTVALNELMSRKRSEKRWRSLTDDTGTVSEDAPAEAAGPSEAPIIEMMRKAVETAFTNCESEEFVLLQLAHCDRLQGQEIAVMFGCSPGTITRRLAAAEEKIERSTLEYVRSCDPWLELRWEDFRELCRSATPAWFEEEG